MFSEVRKRVKKSGQPPGTPFYTGKHPDAKPVINVYTYSSRDFKQTSGASLEECQLDKIPPGTLTWVDVGGLHDVELIKNLAKHFELHPLTVEDILNIEQRPKVEEFDNYLFITLKTILWNEKSSTFKVKQVCFVLGKDFVLSFQEFDINFFDKIAQRLSSTPNQRLRQHGADYLVYRLIDAIVDQYFVVLEEIGDQMEQLEEAVIAAPNPNNARLIYRMKRQMLLLRKAVWPMREAIGHLVHIEDRLISKFTRIYMRDVYDHTVQAIDTLETFRDMLSSMLDMYLSSLTNRMNEIMKTLTIIATIFIPITWLASIYGMNFQYMPELRWRYSYPIVLSVMLCVVIGMLIYFRRKKWL